ncbi:hypothetical protein [Demequina maris]|uniref:hypothetical protein n=1 Tax=Demequina maris TaxID=1638982 RepID=UPI000785DE66|nr:hypothetical protein [Demequina maris]
MSTLAPGADASLAPLRATIRARAEAAAREADAEAESRARRLLDDAHGEAEAIVRRAVEAGTAAARSDAALRSARARRTAHERELRGREDLRRRLEARVLERASALRNDPGYPGLRDALADRARAVLGPEAVVEAAPEGGIVATAGTRMLDLRLPVLARATLDSMSDEVAALWTS